MTRQSSFRYPSFRGLKQRLGEFDAICECVELAIRELMYCANGTETLGKASSQAKRDQFMLALSTKHGVRVNSFDDLRLRTHVVHLYLVSVQHSLEEFLISMKKEHLLSSTWNMGGDEDRLTKIAAALAFKRTLAFDVCQYYREVRNAFVHPAAKVPSPAPLSALVTTDGRFKSLSAPNAFTQVTFDDFVLFTRCVKTLAEELCVAGRPSDGDLERIADEYATRSGATGRLARNPSRLARAKSGYLQSTYSLSPEEANVIVGLGSLA